MKKIAVIIALTVVAVAGFAVGRLTGVAPGLNVNAAKRVFPMLPVPSSQDLESPPVNAAPAPVPTEADDNNVVLEIPSESAVLSGSFEVAGRARAASQSVMIVVRDAAGESLFEARSAVDAKDPGQFGRFSQSVTLPQHELGKGSVEVYVESPEGGEPQDLVRHNVLFSEPDMVAAKVYFRMTGFDAQESCATVLPVERTVSSKTAIYRAVIDELVRGPSEAERTAGYATSLPSGVTLKSVAADADGVVTADFTSSLERGVAGSCRVTAIRAQITSTLKQFPEVRDVIISVNGRVDDVLQP